ncbi:MAG: hypothetical protein IJX05_02845 [Clostridia bacterium]|nr:hypothetical protein [Clostridia bacterium]
MRNKRLIILLSILGGIAAVIILMSAIFTVYSTEAKCLTDYGDDNSIYSLITVVDDKIEAVADEFKFQNIFLVDEQKILDEVNARVPRAEAVDVECIFPNKLVVKYNLVTEALQFKVGEKYVISGESGKIVRESNNNVAQTSDTVIDVTPNQTPVITEGASYVYSDSDCYDMRALKTILSLSSSLVDSNHQRAFDKSAYESIDLADKNNVKIKMRKGVAFVLAVSEDKLADAVQAMVSWYVDVTEDKLFHGEVLVHYNNVAEKIQIVEKT